MVGGLREAVERALEIEAVKLVTNFWNDIWGYFCPRTHKYLFLYFVYHWDMEFVDFEYSATPTPNQFPCMFGTRYGVPRFTRRLFCV